MVKRRHSSPLVWVLFERGRLTAYPEPTATKVSKDGKVSWQVRWRDGGRGSRMRSRTFSRKADAMAFDDELRRRRRLGELVGFAGAQETLNHYVAETWASDPWCDAVAEDGEPLRGPV